jgi:phage terminase small subunit
MPRAKSRKAAPRKTALAKSTSSADDRRERFAQEYLVDLNPSAAYRRVYGNAITPGTAWSNGWRLLRNAEVAARIAELKSEQLARLHIEQDRPIRQLRNIIEADIRTLYTDDGRLLPITEWPDETAAAIANVKVRRVPASERSEAHEVLEFKLSEKIGAIRALMQHLGMLTDKHELTGRDGAALSTGTVLILPSNGRDGD